MFKLFFILFITVPLVEIYILIQVGNWVGAVPTLSLIVLTAIIGAFLLRLQGLQTLARVQTKLQHGELPATDMVEGLILLISGALLLTPGFFTDCIGFICLVPQFRTYIAIDLIKQLLRRNTTQTRHRSVTLEGDFWEDNKHQ